MYQQITLVGNLGKDPEMRYTTAGDPVTSFSVATSKSWIGKDGQKNEKTIWFRVTAWRKLADLSSTYLHKGSRVLVVGEMEEPQAYVNKEGQPKASLEMTAREIRFLTPKGEEDSGYSSGPRQPAAGQMQQDTLDEDIPF